MQLNVPAGEAFAILVRGMEGELTVDQHQARQRIQRSYDLSSPVNIQRLFEERLQDLDVLLFGGALGGKVPVVWKAFPPHLWGETTGGRPGEAGQKSAICIELAECLLLFAATRPDWVLGTLIHELLHVYALVMSPKHEMCRCGHRVAHGPGFAAAAKAAVKVLEVKGLALESVGNWEMGYCHSDHDEVVLQAIERMREESGECTLSEELRGTVLSWWAGIEQIVVDGVDARKME